jgi:acyl-CoA synthetase (AMP-forming)/AMP-acid ligase II
MIRSPFPDVEIPDTPLTEFVLAGAGELGDKPALIDAPTGRTITYAQLAESVRAVAAGLAERGFSKGDVFAHYAPNLPEYAVAFHAVATLGGINTTANPLLTADELTRYRPVAGHQRSRSTPPRRSSRCRTQAAPRGCPRA